MFDVREEWVLEDRRAVALVVDFLDAQMEEEVGMPLRRRSQLTMLARRLVVVVVVVRLIWDW